MNVNTEIYENKNKEDIMTPPKEHSCTMLECKDKDENDQKKGSVIQKHIETNYCNE